MNHLLPQIKSPEQLLHWMNHNLKYEGRNKGFLRTPETLIENKHGHCWETTELERRVLTDLGFKCFVLYIEDRNCTTTHTSLIYESNRRHYWFEWAWYKHSGIYSFNDKQTAIETIRTLFVRDNGEPSIMTVSEFGSMFTAKDNESSAIAKFRDWKKAVPDAVIEIFSKAWL